MKGVKSPGQDEKPESGLEVDVVRDRVPLSRSPHPYHRRGDCISQGDNVPLVLIDQSATVTATASSESGTEADDEKGAFLKSLPAPPLRSRKGLRGSTPPASLTPSRSPLPTPPAVIQQEFTGYFHNLSQHEKERDESEDRRRTREYIQRKAKEIVRRTFEFLLLVATCLVTWTSVDPTLLQLWHSELVATIALPSLLYLAYPIRKFTTTYTSGTSVLKASWLGFHIPSRFDPGPLLYPLVLPVIISMAVLQDRSAYLPVNLVCGLSSIPERVTAIWHRNELMWYLKWIITIVPFHVSRRRVREKQFFPSNLTVGGDCIDLETLALLFPLHYTLKTVLEFLTTTSLDPSELELLTTCLINLLLFAKSPQAHILKAVIWVGGLSIFLTCRHLLSWEVALARIPKWRFSKQSQSAAFSERLKRAIQAFTSASSQNVESSDDEIDDRARPRPLLRVKTLAVPHVPALKSPASASPTSNGAALPFHRRGRRSTFSALEPKAPLQVGELRRSRRFRLAQSSYFLSLTAQQALVRKYAYAGLAYVLVLAILFGPVWYYVATRALSGCEPLGWALGYAFGNIPALRKPIYDWHLEQWIKLPEMASSSTTFFDLLQYPGNQRLLICLYCLLILFIGIIVVLSLTAYVEVDTRRKVFHGVMVFMLLPTIFVDPCFLAMALSVILAAFLLLDLFRASQLPPISRPLTNFLAPYTDGRDHRGPVIVSHIFLLIGCATPLWFSLAGLSRTGNDPWKGWEVERRDRNLSMISGVVCVGMGDAAASLIGRRYGKTKWYWAGGKSLEGSSAFAAAVTVGLMLGYFWLRIGGWIDWDDFDPLTAVIKCVIAGCAASLLESVLTAANDNVVVPIGLWLWVRGLQI